MTENESKTAPQNSTEWGGVGEMAFAIVVCALAMFLPIILIEHGYEQFTEAHGIAREGAAGAALALAVVLRTVSRTILRAIVRTSARAGLKAGVRGAMHGVLRVAIRNLFASFIKTAFRNTGTMGQTDVQDDASLRRANIRSLMLGSALLYASWVIVIGLGQPFGNLMNAEQAAAAQEAESKAIAAALEDAKAKRLQPDITAYELDQRRNALRDAVLDKRKELKGARDLAAQTRAANELSDLNAELIVAQTELSDALMKSGGRMTRPTNDEKSKEREEAAELESALFTRAPYPGPTRWSSPVIWAGAVLFVLPLWFIYFVQSKVARRLHIRLRHETGLDGGLIQLYFAGALSFMPLSSDVVVEGTKDERGRVSLAGLVAPTVVAVLLWLVWKLTGGTIQPILLAADAFLIYPMVQSFPLSPLDGNHVFRWRRSLWLVMFLVVMGVFIFMGSEGLKSVI